MLQLLSVANYSSLPTEHKGIKKPKRKTVNLRPTKQALPHHHKKKKKKQPEIVDKGMDMALNRPYSTSHSLAWNSRPNHVNSLGFPTPWVATISNLH